MNTRTGVYGASWQDQIAGSSPAFGRGWTLEDGMALLSYETGFRLVFDEGERHDRGAPWTESSAHVRTPSSHRSFERAGFNALGFRLCADWSSK